MPCSRSPGGGGRCVSHHALQVCRVTPKGSLRGLAGGEALQAHTQGKVEGSGLGGSPGPHPGMKVKGSGQGGLQTHTWEGVYPSMH